MLSGCTNRQHHTEALQAKNRQRHRQREAKRYTRRAPTIMPLKPRSTCSSWAAFSDFCTSLDSRSTRWSYCCKEPNSVF